MKSMTLKERREAFSKRPKRKFLWSGIKEKSFGLVFGPAKSGKTIFCENMAMKIALGESEYFGYPLSGEPKKVLIVGMEEYWEDSTERNLKQLDALPKEKQDLLNENLVFNSTDFENMILTDQNWKNLEDLVSESGAEVVFIDSITRMCPGKMENSDTALSIMKRLRDLCHNQKVTLVCIHHTPKMYGSPITVDKIKGSVVFQQEIDFAIGINKTPKGFRYQKNVIFRYASEDNEFVKEFEIDDDIWLQPLRDVDEDELLQETDRRRKSDSRNSIIKFLDNNKTSTFKTSELVSLFTTSLSLSERQVKTYLSDLVKNNKISYPDHGYYGSIDYNSISSDGAEGK